MMEVLLNQLDVVEVYSPPRVAAMARRMGMRQGWSLDLTTCDKDGRAWGFKIVEMWNGTIRPVAQDKPIIPIGSALRTIQHNEYH